MRRRAREGPGGGSGREREVKELYVMALHCLEGQDGKGRERKEMEGRMGGSGLRGGVL